MLLRSLTSDQRVAASLTELPVFSGCSPADLRRVSRLTTFVDVEAGRVICRQGDIGRECCIVVTGRATVAIDGHVVAEIGPGYAIGELALLARGGRRSATVTAQTPMTLLAMTRAEFASLLATTPPLAQVVIRESSVRLLENAGSPARAR
jgi:CRP-like cAMP-binding protein